MDYLVNGELINLYGPREFKVSLLENTEMPAKDRKEKIQFQREVAKMQGEISSYSSILSEISNKITNKIYNLKNMTHFLKNHEKPYCMMYALFSKILKQKETVKVLCEKVIPKKERSASAL